MSRVAIALAAAALMLAGYALYMSTRAESAAKPRVHLLTARY